MGLERRWAKLKCNVSTGIGSQADLAPVLQAGTIVRVGNGESLGNVHVFWGDLWASVDKAEVEFCDPPPTAWDWILGECA